MLIFYHTKTIWTISVFKNITHAYEEIPQELGKNHPKGLDVAVPLVLTELGIESVPTNQTGKPFDAGTLGKVQRKVLPQ